MSKCWVFFWSVFGHFSHSVVIWFSALRDNCSVKLEPILWYVSLTNCHSQKSCLPSFDFPRKFFMWFLSLGNTIPWKRKVYCLEYVVSILKTGSWQFFCKGTFITGESDSAFSMCSFSHFVPRIWSLLIPLKNFACFFFPWWVLFLRIQAFFLGYWICILKQKLSMMKNRKCSYKNNRKELQNSVCHLRTESYWNQLVQEHKKSSCTTVHISPKGKVKFSQLGKRWCSYTLRITHYRKFD